jgi:hypothetical protein
MGVRCKRSRSDSERRSQSAEAAYWEVHVGSHAVQPAHVANRLIVIAVGLPGGAHQGTMLE